MSAQERVDLAREATERLLSQNDRANRTKNQMIAVLGSIIILLLVAFGVVTVSDQNRVDHVLLKSAQQRTSILNDVRQTVDPASTLSKRNTAQVQQLVIQIQLCIERHEDIVVDQALHRPAPPNLPGCPVDRTR